MSYIYDIVLNFNKEYYEFFEWKKSDKIINVKKIPVFKVSTSDISIFKYDVIKVEKEFLDKIFELTLFYSKIDYKYMCLISDGNETIGLMFDKEGNLIKRSGLIFDEENEVNDEVVDNDIVNINYVIKKHNDIKLISRVDKEKKEYLYKYINDLDIENDKNIFKYMYYDYFEEEEENVVKIKEKLLDELVNENCDKNKLYELVRVFKKIKN